MFRRIFLAALAAGVGVGVLLAALQHLTLVPLILKAETYEHRAPEGKTTALPAAMSIAAPRLIAPAHAHEAHASAAAGGAASAARIAQTFLATTLVSIGFALLLVGGFSVSGRDIEAREGLLWGLAGFAGFALAPAFGLAPTLPGSAEADLAARQVWWIGTAAATLAGIGLAALGRWSFAVPVGLALIVLPHLIGAPQPQGTGTLPPELAASFAARSLAVAAVFWAVLGWTAGALYARLGRAAAA